MPNKETPHPCPYSNRSCLCQHCETWCGRGRDCFECRFRGMAVHTIVECRDFVGEFLGDPAIEHTDKLMKE